MEFTRYDETYHITSPVMSVNGIIFGKPYMDVTGKAIIKNLKTKEHCEIEFHKRGWKGQNHKVDGQVFNEAGQVMYKLEGSWDKEIVLVDL
jgi:hypothetical protein